MELYKSPRKAGSIFSSDFVPYQAPYEASFFTLDDFPGLQFCTWGIFELVPDADEDLLAELRADGWEPWKDSNKELFFLLQLQLAQTLIILENFNQRYWARTADIHFAANYPVLLTYQTTDKQPLDTLSPTRTHGRYALIEDGDSPRLFRADQLGEEASRLCEQIRAGMLTIPFKDTLTQKQARELAERRRARWKQTHEAAQQLAKLYWNFYQSELNSRYHVPQRRLPELAAGDVTRLPLTNAFLGLVQSFGPSMRPETWTRKPLSGELQLMTPNGARLRLMRKTERERTALNSYVNETVGPEGLKHLLTLVDVYQLQTGGRDAEAKAEVSLRQLLLRLKKGKKADTQEERSKIMHTILYLARASILSPEYTAEAGTRPQSFSKQQELPQHYAPLLVVEPAKPGPDGGIYVPEEVEYHLGKEFFEALFGEQKQSVIVPTTRILDYHAVRQQHELLLAFYLSNRLALAGGRFYIPFPTLLQQCALQAEEALRRSHDRTRNVSRVLFALEGLERDGLLKRAAYKHIDTVLLAELKLEHCTRYELAPATLARIQEELEQLQERPYDDLVTKRRVAIQRLLLESEQAHAVLFSAGPLLQKQSALQKVAQAQQALKADNP